ncbi:class I SAM-dependent methyltransferase [Sphingomicrobium astaxanthinifaciens]|uniref:class I SAM-dependent methyltransferase n=1 Tax=Sphingomicrobium astaxanthinifaciens TaxID=1227949 RepID=UPI001FCC85D8|nr:class I SAM-dependent methyltransferase [Sphingomicrobium astaxanthinifaciens]MCJ7421410.1 class I SAM-dependent methyltransferase [Sphingomicrobium astaxanthinifaciens]
MNKLAHIRERQRVLREAIAYDEDFELWEESCVPSYCHPNPLAAGVSWLRLFAAAKIAKRVGPPMKRVLDFGSSIGELGHLFPKGVQYDFIESHDPAAQFLKQQLPEAKQTTLDDAPDGAYDHIFAIDSLEHNTDYVELLERLVRKLSPGGVLILSGPTENRLYRLGRRVAGFEGHYHETNIHAIEAATAKMLSRRAATSILPVATLFRVTAWQAPTA